MEYGELKQALAAALSNILVGHGFRVSKATQGAECTRRISGGKQRIVFAVVNHKPQYRIKMAVILRFDKLANILDDIEETEAKYRNLTTNSTTNLDYFSGAFNHRYDVRTIEELNYAVLDLGRILTSKVIPLLDGCKDIRAFDALMNAKTFPKFDPDVPYGVINSLIEARVAGNPDFERLIIEGRKSVENLLDRYRQLFEKSVEYLKRYDENGSAPIN